MKKNRWFIIVGLGLSVMSVCLCLGCIVLVILFTQAQPTSPSIVAESVITPTDTPRPVPTAMRTIPTETPRPVPTATLSPESAFSNLAIASGKDYKLTLNIPTKIENGQATAEYKLDTNLFDEESVLRSFTLTFRKLAPNTFKSFPQVTTLLTGVMVPFKDVYGKTMTDTGVIFRMTRATAEKMNWDTYNSFNLDKILTGKSDQFYVADPLLATWKRLAK